LVERLKAIAMERRRFGYRRIGLTLRRAGWVVNHKRVHRIYRNLGLHLRGANAAFVTSAATKFSR
jgi:putative transposase